MNKIFLIIISMFVFSKISHSKDYYYCKDFDYSITGYSEKWGKSWVPENLLFIKDENKITISGKKTEITEDSEKKIKFFRKAEHNSKKSGKKNFSLRLLVLYNILYSTKGLEEKFFIGF